MQALHTTLDRGIVGLVVWVCFLVVSNLHSETKGSWFESDC